METIDRRGFIRGAAAGAAGLAAAGIFAGSALAADGAASASASGSAAGSASASAASASASSASASGSASASAASASASASGAAEAPAWLGAEPTLSPSDIVDTESTDLLIIGAGCAGMAAAGTACDLGMDFILCEKTETVPETREYLGAVNTVYSLAAGDPVDTGKLLNEISRYASGKCDRDLIKLWIDNSAEMIDWIDPLLVAAGKTCIVDNPGDHATGGTDYYLPVVQHCWLTPYEPPMRNDVLLAHIQDAGNEVRFAYDLVELVHADGKVTGAIFDTDDGYKEIDAKYVLLATGGYAGNPQMIEALQPDTVKCITACSYNPPDTGMGIKAGIWAGAAKENDVSPVIFDRGAVTPGVDSGYVTDGENTALPGTIYQLNIGSQPFLKVNRNGERFANESTPYDNMIFATGRQPGGVFCQVFDGNASEDIKRFMMIGCAAYTRMMMEQGMSVDDFLAMDGGDLIDGVVMKADTLDELADKLGFSGDAKTTFLATVDRYNSLYDAQEDTDYGKEAYRLSEIRTAPFYGTWFGGSLLTTLDGLRINAKMQVLDDSFEPIEGLYAAGDCSGSFFATNYPEYIPGLAAGRSVTEGRQVVKMLAGDTSEAPVPNVAAASSAASGSAVASSSAATSASSSK